MGQPPESKTINSLRARFVDGALVDPRGGNADTVDLMRAVALQCGVTGFEESERLRLARETVGDPDHVVFVLLDGLGINLLDRLEPAGFFRTASFRELRALAPSTTACVLTALATGVYPANHALTGWFTHLPEHGRTTIPLQYVDRFTGEAMDTSIAPEDMFPVPSMLPRMTVATHCLLPIEYWDSPYSRYWRGGTPGEGYVEIGAAVDRILGSLDESSPRSFTYLYIPHIDHVSHEQGPGGAKTLAIATSVEKEIERLADGLPGNARLICTADHGQIHIPQEGNFLVFDGDPMLELLVVPPSGEGRLPLFHVMPGCRDRFCALFEERYGQNFLLLSIDEVEALQLFGPGRMTPLARSRFGDFIAIPVGPWVLNHSPPEKDPADTHLGRHGGLSPEEMRVPLLWW